MFKFAQWICVCSMAVAALDAQTSPPAPFQVMLTSGMVGIAEGQTAQLNALNPGVAPPALGEICTGLLAFVGDDGTVLKSLTVHVAPGTSQSLALFADKDLALAVNARKEIRATIKVPPVPPPTTSATPVMPVCRLIGGRNL